MDRIDMIASKLAGGISRKAVPQMLRIKTLMDDSAADRRQQERELNRYVSTVGAWLQRLTGQGSRAKDIYDQVSEEFEGRNGGTVLSQRQRKWVSIAKQEKEILEFTEYIGGPDRMTSAALYLVRDVVSGQKLLRDAKGKAEGMAKAWYMEHVKEQKADVFEEGGYAQDFRKFLPPDVSFVVGPTREIQEIVESFGRAKKNWAVMTKKVSFVAERYNDIVRQVKSDMNSNDEVTKLQALMTAITIETGIRPGAVGNMAENPDTGEMEETFGVTTLEPRHVKFVRDNFVELNFVGKKTSINIATLSDAEVINALKKLVDASQSGGGSGLIFVTKAGEHVDDNSMRKYVRDRWGDITPTDFRKMRATQQFYDSLKKRIADMRIELSGAVVKGKKELKELVVAKIMAVLDGAANEAQKALSHDKWTTTIKSYVDPRVVVNFLSQGGLEDTLEDILINNKNVRLQFDFDAFVTKAGRAA